MTKKMIMAWMGILLLAGCTQTEEAGMEPGSLDAVPIRFDCYSAEGSVCGDAISAKETRAANGTTGFISSENGHLYYSGFGVFAREEGATSFDFMSNQKVEYTFLANDPTTLYDGYWSYQPLKYWPHHYDSGEGKNIPTTLQFCAYAPYVERPETPLPAGTKGIIDVSDANAPTPTIFYARADRLEEAVDLLWCYLESNTAETAALQMSHALARLGVSITLTSKAANIQKVLVERITLEGIIATQGTLDLTSHTEITEDEKTRRIPTWTVASENLKGTNIVIDHDPASFDDPSTDTYSYGIIAESVRYVEGLPERWQPAGLQVGTTVNVLTQDDDQPTHILLIPQETLKLKAHLVLHIYYTDSTPEATVRRRTDSEVEIANPLQGNTPYNLNLQIAL